MFLYLNGVYLLQKSKPDDPEEKIQKKKNPEWDITSQREIRRRKPEFLEQV